MLLVSIQRVWTFGPASRHPRAARRLRALAVARLRGHGRSRRRHSEDRLCGGVQSVVGGLQGDPDGRGPLDWHRSVPPMRPRGRNLLAQVLDVPKHRPHAETPWLCGGRETGAGRACGGRSLGTCTLQCLAARSSARGQVAQPLSCPLPPWSSPTGVLWRAPTPPWSGSTVLATLPSRCSCAFGRAPCGADQWARPVSVDRVAGGRRRSRSGDVRVPRRGARVRAAKERVHQTRRSIISSGLFNPSEPNPRRVPSGMALVARLYLTRAFQNQCVSMWSQAVDSDEARPLRHGATKWTSL